MADDAGTSLKGRVSAEEWQARIDCAALYRLVVQPMLAAGFTYSTPQMPHDILARVNHYPSLVQVLEFGFLER